jgi:hypothetical protein
MARRAFFSFHYERDLWRVNVVRNNGEVEGVSAAGFYDVSLWEESKRKGEVAVKKLIDAGLNGTAVTVVLIGMETAYREFVSYEIKRSVARGNGILGIRINNIKDQFGHTDPAGPIPAALTAISAEIYTWDYGKLGQWVEKALQNV